MIFTISIPSGAVTIGFSPMKRHEILKVKEWVRRKRIMSVYSEKKVNPDFYSHIKIPVDILSE